MAKSRRPQQGDIRDVQQVVAQAIPASKLNIVTNEDGTIEVRGTTETEEQSDTRAGIGPKTLPSACQGQSYSQSLELTMLILNRLTKRCTQVDL